MDGARKLIFEGKYPEAQQMIEEHMLGPWTASYQSMGDLYIQLDGNGEASDYRRELSLNDAVCRTQFTLNGVRYSRETFVSAVDQIMVVRMTADQPGKVSLQASLDSLLNHSTRKGAPDMIILSGQSPSRVDPFHAKSTEPVIYEEEKGVRFEVQLRALPEGGRVEAHGNRLWENAAGLCREWLARAAEYSYDELLQRHLADYRELFGRVELELNAPGLQELPTDERIQALRDGEADEQLAVLFFQFGRYLLIASSRPGTQPATLQGIWNDRARPPWACNYTVNINTQMNYWLAETCNLAECHMPLFDMLEDLRSSGKETARVHYKARGWVSHHSVDLWRITTPSGGPSQGPASWAFWPMAGAWLCQHLWEHYWFGGDRAFLEGRAYPIMREAALFFLDWLVPDSEGYLVTNPSTSPENTFIGPDGRKSAVSLGSTMDNSLIWELFTHCIEASAILDTDEELRKELTAARAKLRPLAVGRHGQLQEWFEDFEEAEPGHRHMAHLYALHPGHQIDKRADSTLANACRVTIERRLLHEKEDAIGWCFAWLISLFARLEDPEMAHRYLTKLLKNPFPNLFNAHRHPKLTFHPLTIEANFGATAGIAELLLQSHAGELSLLPALPGTWPEGRIRGLRARGGFTVNMEWSSGRLRRAVIESINGNVCRIREGTPVQVNEGAVEILDVEPSVVEFRTEAGAAYIISPLA
ncbi:glycoside hydrolase N-terminal domain-containing protein [Paenibacillus solisilvae]|uniref:Glycoside hydrolase N-terminal domain-containing protein n=1 Tax=Paenibacillus solisilvae TaxID=2486751 RepID=A0ABW0W661_9BACL